MSTNLYWLPIKPQKAYDLSTELKFALRNRDNDGHVNEELDDQSLGYLRGLLDAGIKDAEILIDAIDKYGAVRVFEE